MKKMLSLMGYGLISLSIVSCANSPLGSIVNNHPTMEDVEGMKVGKTTQKEINEKYSGHKKTLMNGASCYTYFKPSLVGEATKTTYLCFKEGVLSQKYFM